MITVEQARAILASLTPRQVESVPIREAAGRVLARAVAADRDWPPFDTSAMDGYAVRVEDLARAGSRLEERGSPVMAGDPFPPPLSAGAAVRVMTGSPLPQGADAVIPVELCRRDGSRVAFERLPRAGANIRRRGESIAAGAELVAAGRRLDAGSVALLALAGADPVAVFRRSQIVLAVTGNEIVPSDGAPAGSQLRDSNGPMLIALCRARGWPVRDVRRIADEPAAVGRLFAGGEDADVLLTTGGVSAGDLDLLPAAAAEAGFEILFHGVSMRPGKPVVFARRDRALWFGLPGNPVSASVGFQLLVREALDRLEGDCRPGPVRLAAVLDGELPATGPRETYRDARLSQDAGELRAAPLLSAVSHDIAAHARANALIRTPAGAPPVATGERVECLLLSAADLF